MPTKAQGIPHCRRPQRSRANACTQRCALHRFHPSPPEYRSWNRFDRLQVHGSRTRKMRSRRPIHLHRRNKHRLEHPGIYVHYVPHRSPKTKTKDQNHRASAPATASVRPEPRRLAAGPIPEPTQRAILRAPNSIAPQPIHRYDLRSRRGAPSAKCIHRNHRNHRRAYAAVLPIPEAYIPPALNLDVNGKPLTYRSAKNGPDRLVWERAEADELIRLLDTKTIVPI